jgi:hypothetical protein
MTKIINKITMRDIENKNQQFWFSLLQDKIEKLDFGKLEVKLTIRKGEVKNIQCYTGDSHQVPE